jgi:uncharacterized protein YabN with tetrapyrrole methylase and pyrophosphatase domain
LHGTIIALEAAEGSGMDEHDTGSTGHGDLPRGTLVVVGTGIQAGGQTTLAARRAIERADKVLFAVVDPWAVSWIRSLNRSAESLPYPMDESLRRKTYEKVVERILAELDKGQRVCAVFYGHPGVLTTPVHAAVARARRQGFRVHVLPGVSALDCLFADLDVDPGRDGCQIYESTDFLIRARGHDVHSPLILCQIGSIGNLGFFDEHDTEGIARGLSVLVEVLAQRYPPDHQVVIYEAAVLPTDTPRIEPVALSSVIRARMTELSTLYVPPLGQAPLDAEMMTRLGMDPPQPPTQAAPELRVF